MNDPKHQGERSMAGSGHNARPTDTLKAYVDGELSGPRHWMTRRHIERCRSCRQESEALKRLSNEIQRLPEPAPRPELRRRIMANLPTTPPVRTAQPAVTLRQPRLTIGFAACTGLLIGAFAMGRHSALISPQKPIQSAEATDSRTGATRGARRDGTHDSRTTLVDRMPPTPVAYTATNGVGPDATTYRSHDLYSRRADEATERALAHHTESDANENVVLRRESPFGKGTTSDPFRLAVATSDSTASDSQLRRLIEDLGGTLTPVPGSEAAPTRFRTLGKSLPVPYPTVSTDASRPGLFLLARVPASQAAVLRHGLQELARAMAESPIKKSSIKDSSAMTEPTAQGTVHDPQRLPDLIPVPSPKQPGQPQATTPGALPFSMPIPSKRVDTTPTVGVTYLIWLRPSQPQK